MAFLRAVLSFMLLASGEAVFKRDVKGFMEAKAFPDLGGLGDAMEKAAQGAQDIVSKGQNAVEAVKDAALDVFKAGAVKVNASLKVVGREVVRMNVTASREIRRVDEKVKDAEDKTLAFAEGGSRMLKRVEPIFDQVVKQLQGVSSMAEDVLKGLNQDQALTSLKDAMDVLFTTAQGWKTAVEDLSEEMSKQVKELIPRRARGQGAEEPSTTTMAMKGEETEAPILLQDPSESFSEALKSPYAQLKHAAQELGHMSSEAMTAMSKLADAAVEAAKDKLPSDLMENVTMIFKGVEAEAEESLAPLGEIGQQLVNGIYKAAGDAGLVLDSSAWTALPWLLMLGLLWF